MITLSKRLEAIASLITPGYIVADVGTDHGYIPIYQIQQNRSPSAIAMDLRKGPLQRAADHIQSCGLSDRIQTRLSDGPAALGVGEAETIVVAGMGGELVLHILTDGEAVCRSAKELILQPQSEIAGVRRYLREHAYRIVAENMIYEDGKYYPMMRVVPVAGGAPRAAEIPVSGNEPRAVEMPVAGNDPRAVEMFASGNGTLDAGIAVAGNEPRAVEMPVSGDAPRAVEMVASGNGALDAGMPVSGSYASAVEMPVSGDAPRAVEMFASGNGTLDAGMPVSGGAPRAVEMFASGNETCDVEMPMSGNDSHAAVMPASGRETCDVELPIAENEPSDVEMPASGNMTCLESSTGSETLALYDLYGELLLKEKHPVLRQYLIYQENLLNDILDGLRRQPDTDKIRIRIGEIEKKLYDNQMAQHMM
jgi:tRNA (adenine22-N1)-methyltransferase